MEDALCPYELASDQRSPAGGTPRRVGWAAETLALVLSASSLLPAAGQTLDPPGLGKAQTLHGPAKPWTFRGRGGSAECSHCPQLCGTGGDRAGSSPPSDTILGGTPPAFCTVGWERRVGEWSIRHHFGGDPPLYSPPLAGKGGLVSVGHPIATSDPSRVGPGDERRPQAALKGPASPAVPPRAPHRLCLHPNNPPSWKGGFGGTAWGQTQLKTSPGRCQAQRPKG